MQRPEQAYCPSGHALAPHAPAVQNSPAAHATPPAHPAPTPQCAGSFRGSTQVPPQFTRLGAHETAQVPAEQTWPAPQATPSAHVVDPQ